MERRNLGQIGCQDPVCSHAAQIRQSRHSFPCKRRPHYRVAIVTVTRDEFTVGTFRSVCISAFVGKVAGFTALILVEGSAGERVHGWLLLRWTASAVMGRHPEVGAGEKLDGADADKSNTVDYRLDVMVLESA